MTEPGEPLTPPDCDCRGLPFMPLDTVRLRDSDLAALSSGEEFKAAVLLWCASWSQLPAASLPDDERILARLAGVSLAEWRTVSPMALKGWIKCADGRLYHAVVAEKALEAWAGRQRQRERARKRWDREADQPSSEDTASTEDAVVQPAQSRGTENPMPRHGSDDAVAMQGTGTERGKEKEKETGTRTSIAARSRNGGKESPEDRAGAKAFREFWAVYPNKVGAKPAVQAFLKVLPKLGPDPLAVLLPALERAKASRQWREGFVPHPSTWLNQERWTDEYLEPPRVSRREAEHLDSLAAIDAASRAAGHAYSGGTGRPFGPLARAAEHRQRLADCDAAMRAAFGDDPSDTIDGEFVELPQDTRRSAA